MNYSSRSASSYFVLLLILISLHSLGDLYPVSVDAGGIRHCGRGKVFNACATPKKCEITCDNIANPPDNCADVCVPRCACPPHRPYIKKIGDHEFCVKKCEKENVDDDKTEPPTNKPTKSDPRCVIKGAKWNDCASACPPTCKDPNPETCIAECIEQCECPPGTILNDELNPPECVEKCPNAL